jgi:hypothetical protein
MGHSNALRSSREKREYCIFQSSKKICHMIQTLHLKRLYQGHMFEVSGKIQHFIFFISAVSRHLELNSEIISTCDRLCRTSWMG